MHRRHALYAAVLCAAALPFPGTAGAQDADTPLDRALQKVEALLTRLRAEAGTDPKLVQNLEEVAGELRNAKASPPAPAAPGAPGAPGAPAGRNTGAVSSWTKDSFFKDVELSEAEQATGEEILRDFATDYGLARAHEDEKSRQVIHDYADRRIDRSFAKRESNRLKDNLAGIIRFWEGRWGRGGGR